jgi:hypothetical protein
MTKAGPDKPPGRGLARPRNGKGRFVRSVDSAERDREAARMRTQGHPYREIADTLGYADEAGAHRAVAKILKETVQEAADELRKVEVERLDALLQVAWDVMMREHVAVSGGKVVTVADDEGNEVPLRDDGPTLAALDRVIKIADRRAALLGLDAPQKIQSGGTVRYEISGVDLSKIT